MIYTMTFNPALDYVIYTDGPQLGRVNRATRETIHCGGKGINVSIVLKNLGIESTALGFYAGFTGQEVVRQLQQREIKTELVALKSGMTRINVKIKGTVETDINGSGPQIETAEIQQLLKQLAQLQSGDTLVLAGSIPESLGTDTYEQILALLSEKSVRAIVDAEGELLIKALAYHPFLIKPNHHELEQVFGVSCEDEAQIINCIRQIQQMGARNVLVSRADKGAVFGAEDGTLYLIKSPQGSVINSVGAGDSMVAGFLAGSERSTENALRYAVAAGSATAFSEGLASAADIKGLLSTVEITKLSSN